MVLLRARFGVFAVLLAAPLSLPAQVPQVLHEGGDVGKHTSITVDATNDPYLSYFDETNGDVRMIWRDGIWYAATADATGNVGTFSSIAVSATPTLPFISYYDPGNEYLKLAHKTSAGTSVPFDIEQLPLSVRLLARTSIALNSMSVTPIIAFFDVNDQNLKLALFDREGALSSPPLTYPGWGVEIVTPSSNVEDLAFVLDGGEEPHIAYIEQTGTTAVLKYAHKNCLGSGCLTQTTAAQPTGEGMWHIETVTGTGPVGFSVALALDPATGNPLIAYYSNGQLKYAVKSGGSWAVETVPDAAGDVGRHVSIALNTNGDPHLLYYDATNGNLRHAVKTATGWTATTLDGTAADVGQYTAVVIGTDDILHGTYYDVTNADLKYVGPQRPPQGTRNCCAAAGAMALVLILPAAGAGVLRRRLAHERR